MGRCTLSHLALLLRVLFLQEEKQVGQVYPVLPASPLVNSFLQVDLLGEEQVGQVVERGGPRQAIQVKIPFAS